MTPGAGPRHQGRGVFGVLWAFVVWAALTCVPSPTSAQQEQQLFQRQAEYNAELDAYNASVSAWSAQQGRWVAAVDARIAAVNSGNPGRLEDADQVAFAESMELTRQRGVVEAAERTLATARKNLQEALVVRQDALLARAQTASPAQQQTLLSQVRGISEELERLEPEELTGPALRFLPTVDVDRRDGRVEIEYKMALVERRTQDARGEVTRVNDDLARLRTQLERRQMAGDARSNRELFDNGPPGARPGRLADPTQGGTATTTAASPKTIEQRIAELTAYKAELENLQQQLRVRVATFQNRLGVVGGGLQ